MISFKQRVLDVGMNQSGKSELMRFFFVSMNCRRVLVDPKGEWIMPGVPRHVLRARDKIGAEREVAAIDFTAPLVHVVPTWQEWVQLEALFDAIMVIPGELFVWIDECMGVSTASRCPRGLRQLNVAGAGLKHGVGGCTQRAHNIETTFKTEADHVFLLPPLSDDDLEAAISGVPFLRFKQARELLDPLPQHGYLWVSKRDGALNIGPPLPPEYLSYRTDVVRKR